MSDEKKREKWLTPRERGRYAMARRVIEIERIKLHMLSAGPQQ